MKTALTLLALMLAPVPALAQADPVTEARGLAEARRYDEALAILRAARAAHPEDADLSLATARILSWKGDYRAAAAELDGLPPAMQANPEALSLRGNLAYYRADLRAAKVRYQAALASDPGFTEARDGLARVEKAEAADAAEPHWQVDAGLEHSSFSPAVQPDWDQQAVVLTRFLDGGRRAVHVGVTRYHQFGLVNSDIEAGVAGRLSDGVSAYVTAGTSGEADFRPRYRLAAGGEARVAKSGWGALWLGLDGRHDVYRSVTVNSASLAARLEPAEGWGVAARLIRVDSGTGPAMNGYSLRFDGRLSPKVGVYAGFADAPDTVAGVTIDTRSAFAGISWTVDDRTTLRAGYGRDDRENTYVRNGVSVSLSRRF